MENQRLRRLGIFALVFGAHLLLLMLPLRTERCERFQQEESARGTLLFFSRMPVIEHGSEWEPPSPAEPQIQTNITVDMPGVISYGALDGSSTTNSLTAPHVNWSEEARRAAAAAADDVLIPDRSKCDSTGLADPLLPNCKRSPQFKWAPPKAGFSGGLPYINLGDRCVIGLGFFGCALGKPSANGDLLEGMDDPERDWGSDSSPR